MLTERMKGLLENSKEYGWVLEPDTKTLFAEWGLPVPRFCWAKTIEEALNFAGEVGYPVVAKIVSPKIIHKSDVGGVIIGIKDEEELRQAYTRLEKQKGFLGILVEENLPHGTELIIGAKNDPQFGPVVLLGMGGTAVEIYHDVELRLAPLSEQDVQDMVACLKAGKLLTGYRGTSPINRDDFVKLVVTFSNLVMELEPYFDSIDVNPLICFSGKCLIADARIILK